LKLRKTSKAVYSYLNNTSLISIPIVFGLIVWIFIGTISGIVIVISLFMFGYFLRKYTHPPVESGENKSAISVFYFYSPWCFGCLVHDLTTKKNFRGKQSFGFEVIDVTKKDNKDMVEKYEIHSVPTWICIQSFNEKLLYRSSRPPEGVSIEMST
jgi:hypothetical protein